VYDGAVLVEQHTTHWTRLRTREVLRPSSELLYLLGPHWFLTRHFSIMIVRLQFEYALPAWVEFIN